MKQVIFTSSIVVINLQGGLYLYYVFSPNIGLIGMIICTKGENGLPLDTAKGGATSSIYSIVFEQPLNGY